MPGLTPPDRFRSATFRTFEPRSASQADALDAARRFVQAQRRVPSLTERIGRWFGRGPSRPQGLYLLGPAGTGKTHLLAAMYHALTPEVPCAFLHSSTLFRRTEPPDAFARRLAETHDVCCLDEVEIDDPANEMRLVQWMKTLSAEGVALLGTSNVDPERALVTHVGGGRVHRFLQTAFRDRYRVVLVEGADFRRTDAVERTGHVWVGPPARTRPLLERAHAEASGPARRWSFDELRRASTETAHADLIDTLTAVDHLFVEAVALSGTDDALRLLRVVDTLYLREDAPVLYVTAARPPEDWFAPDTRAGVAQAVAEKFTRTVSRLHALCHVHHVGDEAPTGASPAR
ncbi:MAG: AFG1/ZapE family ATPase [Salinibacter sp.]